MDPAELAVLAGLGIELTQHHGRIHISRVYDPTNPRHVAMATPDVDLAMAMTREVLARVQAAPA